MKKGGVCVGFFQKRRRRRRNKVRLVEVQLRFLNLKVITGERGRISSECQLTSRERDF